MMSFVQRPLLSVVVLSFVSAVLASKALSSGCFFNEEMLCSVAHHDPDKEVCPDQIISDSYIGVAFGGLEGVTYYANSQCTIYVIIRYPQDGHTPCAVFGPVSIPLNYTTAVGATCPPW